jgi:type I restriction enzyme, S subunit
MTDDLPPGWAIAALSDIAEINPRHPRDLDDDLLVSFAPMSALSESVPELNGLCDRPLREVRKGFTHFAERDVLFAKITPSMENGKAAVALHLRNGLGCGTTELHVLRPLAAIDPLYVYHFIHQPSFRRDAKANFTGTAGQLRVPVSFMENAKLPLVPLNEQRRIVAEAGEVVRQSGYLRAAARENTTPAQTLSPIRPRCRLLRPPHRRLALGKQQARECRIGIEESSFSRGCGF